MNATLASAVALTAAMGSAEPTVPLVYTLHPGALAAARERVRRDDPAVRPAFSALRAEADRALELTPPSVMDKKQTAASGDRHDYFSFGPYWWPDPGTPDGRPYIRRDGQTNPAARQGTDRLPVQQMGDAFETLAYAYFFTGREDYAQQAVRLLRAWFLDPATRMNPHMRYAQAIPGVTDGRGIGIIEARYFMRCVEAYPLVFGSPAWTKEDERGFREWLVAWRDWLRGSENGRDEADEENNHGTLYDVTLAQLDLMLGHGEEAKAHLAAATRQRIASQIEPDGRQPKELARTRSFNYSMLNLQGLVQLAVLGEYVGVDAWSIETEDGRSLAAAFGFHAPFADPAREWIADDIDRADRARVLPLLAEAVRHLDDEALRALLARHEAQAPAEARWRLFR
jgi:hypothetical protein